ncbi:hypothetical protein B0H34DRAFT_793754 [Crassisporium funariophilum]|nr:hypothetical protein B0H34DRAFT_793754 [Crassisporium funariophilum]
MAAQNKRELTDDVREALVASDEALLSTGTPIDVLYRLRNVGSRVRKSVTEGYISPPSTFARAHTTGSIFCSMNDTLRDVYSNAPVQQMNEPPKRKRARSINDTEPPSLAQDTMQSDTQISDNIAYPVATENLRVSRPTKPLRNSQRSMLQTRSLPNGSLSFGSTSRDLAIVKPTVQEEDDWSVEASNEPSAQPFEPMVF